MAALLTGVFSLTQLIVSKENRVSEFRQEWLNNLREEVSKLQGTIETLLGLVEHKLRDKPGGLSDDEISALRAEHPEKYCDLNEMRYRVLLRFTKDEDEHEAIRSKLDKLINAFYGPCDNLDDIRKLQRELVEETQLIVKNTWEKVKRGEKIFRFLRMSLITGIVVFFVSLVTLVPIAYSKWVRAADDYRTSAQPTAEGDRTAAARAVTAADIALAEAAASKNVDRMLSFYDNDAAFINTTSGVITGKEGLPGLWSDFFATPGYALTRHATRVGLSRTG
ncbi:MAG: hypothetical protein A3H94_06090, partial [Acidobacteria bacterium RIFCSPLOWO2_02_FULL_60_20]